MFFYLTNKKWRMQKTDKSSEGAIQIGKIYISNKHMKIPKLVLVVRWVQNKITVVTALHLLLWQHYYLLLVMMHWKVYSHLLLVKMRKCYGFFQKITSIQIKKERWLWPSNSIPRNLPKGNKSFRLMYKDTQCITVYCGTKLEIVVMFINNRMMMHSYHEALWKQ